MKHLASVYGRRFSIAVLAGILCLNSTTAEAGILVTWGNVGSDLVATWSGSIDLTGLTKTSDETSDGTSTSLADPADSLTTFNFISGATNGVGKDEYSQIGGGTTLPPFAQLKEINAAAGNSTGDYFSASSLGPFLGPNLPNLMYVPDGYVSGNPLSGTITFTGESIASVFGTNLSTTPTVMWTLVNNDVSFAQVPEPGSLAMLGVAGLGVGLAAWRRRKKGKSQEA